jgi:hypothetical protein
LSVIALFVLVATATSTLEGLAPQLKMVGQ